MTGSRRRRSYHRPPPSSSRRNIKVHVSSAITMLVPLMVSCQAIVGVHALLLLPAPVVHFGIGAVAGGCGALAYQPFDYIKLQLQSNHKTADNGLDCFMSTLQDNPTDLFRGVTVAVMGVAPEKAIKLGVNDILRAAWTSSPATGSHLPLWCQISAGAVAGACQVIVSSPLDVLKVGLQQRRRSSGEVGGGKQRPPVVQVWNEIIAKQGLGGLYQGYEACLVRDISFTAVCMPLYASLVEAGANPFVAGALSGMVSTFIATPADMVKTRILTQQSSTPQVNMDGILVSTLLEKSSPPIAASLQGDGTLTALSFQRNDTISLTSGDTNNFGSLLVPEKDSTDNRIQNPFWVAKNIVDKEGGGVLFSGVYERCIGAVPRFGITLGVHEWLEHYAAHVGLLS